MDTILLKLIQHKKDFFEKMLLNKESVKTFNEIDYKITEKEIASAINKLKNKKAVGLDSISYEMIKCGKTILMPGLLKIFNLILSSGNYLSEWNIGYLKPLFKGNDPNDPSNYRGISIMPCLSKVFKSILNERLLILMPKARTCNHMFVVKTLTEKYLNNGIKIFACFVDFAKAFDTVIHSILLNKLCDIRITGPFYMTISIKDMYSSNYMHIRLKDTLTEMFMPKIGLRQGDNLSPNLLKLYLYNLPQCFGEADDQVTLKNCKFSCLLYADDLVLLSTSEQGLQSCLYKLSQYSDKYGLSVNLNKTNIYKYLGIIFSSSGTFSHCQNDKKSLEK
ncbi:LIN1-like protein [Mya arenaria]|uniref:LIN1-like protein n=1 Tax=Mya arenaria TaxID=6604 RepID=A0ABY7FQH8_MYAAR|nr:LIN1-like protein [Mya arenaria]